MKKKLILMICIALTAMISACAQSADNKNVATNEDALKLYYFHGQQRCATCRAIEETAKELFDNQFVDEQQNGKLIFSVIDISTPDGEKMADHYKVAFSSLVIDKCGSVNNLTDMAFRYARTDPDTFKARLKSEIEKLLE
ncbi:MAG: thioredoxin [Salinivirgaceae bacterium]|nr:thioredoxin [Salinivirgaceae bacterium]